MKCSTVNALVEMLHDWYSKTDNSRDKNHIHAVLVDYSKAFDRIDPTILMKKLQSRDTIPIFLLHWISDFLTGRTQRVRVGEAVSKELPIWGTVPQGTKLGVFLFILMINDLHTDIPTYKYVDDTTIYSISKNPNCSQVQQAMDTIMQWSSVNRMKINEKKTKEMVISFSKVPPSIPNVVVNGTELERIDHAKLLGVWISNTLTWEFHIEYIVKRAQQRLFFLNMLRRARVSPRDVVQIYCSKVRPVLEYACPVWHGGITTEQSDSIEHVQERAMRIAYPDMDYELALQEANIPTLRERRHNQCKDLFMKMQSPDDKLNRILPPESINRNNTRHHLKYRLPLVHTERYKNSFLPYVLFNCQE